MYYLHLSFNKSNIYNDIVQVFYFKVIKVKVMLMSQDKD